MATPVLNKLREWRDHPLLFVKDCIEVNPSDQQLEGLANFPKTKRMTIRSGHGTGKDAFASWIIMYFLCTRAYAKVVCTAPTNRQLGDILWSELSKWFRKSRIADDFIIQKDKIFHKDAPKEWWCRAVSPSVKASKEDQAETLAGFHGDHLLIVVDEASGVPDPVYIPLEGALTQEDNRVLLIGNMTKNVGYFYDTHFHAGISKDWCKLHWDSRKSSNVTKEMIQYFAAKYGEDSNIFKIRVVGDPPDASENTLISLADAMQCVGNEQPENLESPLVLGVDVARYGEDDSIVLPRRDNIVYTWDTFHGINTIDLAGHVNMIFQEEGADGIAMDEIGVGGPVVDWLHKHGLERVCFGINVANKSSDIKKYDRLRDELWMMVRDKCIRGIYFFPDVTVNINGVDLNIGHELCNELAAPTYDFNEQGGIKVESKKRMKLRGIKSPNIADSLCLTEYFNSFAHKVWKKQDQKREKRRRDKARSSVPGYRYGAGRVHGADNWMCS